MYVRQISLGLGLVAFWFGAAFVPASAEPVRSEPVWEPIGPAPFITNLEPDQLPIHERYSGRIQAIVSDPRDANIIYIGTTGGGIWRTTNGGESWVTGSYGRGGWRIPVARLQAVP
jgi:hypothetical protein